MTTHEVLVRARNLIEQSYWWQLDHNPPGGAVTHCALSAFGYSGRSVCLDAMVKFAEVNGLPTGHVESTIPRWNDRPGRTKEGVLAAFDKAIAATAPGEENKRLNANRQAIAKRRKQEDET